MMIENHEDDDTGTPAGAMPVGFAMSNAWANQSKFEWFGQNRTTVWTAAKHTGPYKDWYEDATR